MYKSLCYELIMSQEMLYNVVLRLGVDINVL